MLILFLNAHAGCDLAALDEAIDASEQAFAKLDDEIDTRRMALNEVIGCLEEPLTQELAAKTHRAQALFSFLDQEVLEVKQYFARYRSLTASPMLPAELAPAKHPMRRIFESSSWSGAQEPLPKLSAGSLRVDGQELKPTDLPFILQHIGADGTVQSTAAYAAEWPLPAELLALAEDGKGKKAKKAKKSPNRARSPRRIPMLVAGGVVAAVGGGLYGGAFASRSSYDKAVDARDRDAAKKAHSQTNGMTIAGIGLIGAGAGLCVAGVL